MKLPIKMDTVVKFIGPAVTALGYGVTVASDFIAKKEMDQKIQKAVAEAVANIDIKALLKKDGES